MTASSSKTVVLGVTASISAYRACDLITDLREAGYNVRVVMTEDAKNFITPLTLQSMAASPVVTDFFGVEGNIKPVHIDLAQNANLILIAPASADMIAKLAHGLADDVLSCTVLASRCPLVIAPAMNEKMYEHPITQANIQKLKSFGVIFVPPIHGHMVCSGQGMGHIAENSSILEIVKKNIA